MTPRWVLSERPDLTMEDVVRFYYDVVAPEIPWGKRLRWVLSEETVRHIAKRSGNPLPDDVPVIDGWHLLGHLGRIDDSVDGLSYEWLER